MNSPIPVHWSELEDSAYERSDLANMNSPIPVHWSELEDSEYERSDLPTLSYEVTSSDEILDNPHCTPPVRKWTPPTWAELAAELEEIRERHMSDMQTLRALQDLDISSQEKICSHYTRQVRGGDPSVECEDCVFHASCIEMCIEGAVLDCIKNMIDDAASELSQRDSEGFRLYVQMAEEFLDTAERSLRRREKALKETDADVMETD
ncbi:hypothetical protein LTR37_004061 [Vermiconidia calcicola]|uniref:Uncharacterized protein n=1 Tax=Vermiconidia calcicola TaxID=1690605 RepID=A0ACC3NMW7_9PEZI|nr:hypothetical protein LTR37_004061 [Vermiconidia calcicola]